MVSMGPARIAVIVPVYNNEKVVRRCIDSILGQTFPDLELVLVDDGSKDGSGAICDAAAAADPRVRVIHKRNEGLMATWMRGVRESSAPYLAFVDADDWIEPQMLEEMALCLADSGKETASVSGADAGEKSSSSEDFSLESDAKEAAHLPPADFGTSPSSSESSSPKGTLKAMGPDCREAKPSDTPAGSFRGNAPKEIVCCSYVIDREGSDSPERRTHGAAPGIYEGERLQTEIKDVLLGNETRRIIASRCMKLFSRALIEDNLCWCDRSIRMGEDLNITTPAILDAERIVVMEGAYYYHYVFYQTSMVHAYDPNLYDNIVKLRAKLLEILMAKGPANALEMTEREYLFLMCIEMKNELRCTIGPAADVVGRIQDICAQEHTGELTKFYPEGVKDPANRILVWMMNHPSSFRVHAARWIFLAQAKHSMQ